MRKKNTLNVTTFFEKTSKIFRKCDNGLSVGCQVRMYGMQHVKLLKIRAHQAKIFCKMRATGKNFEQNDDRENFLCKILLGC